MNDVDKHKIRNISGVKGQHLLWNNNLKPLTSTGLTSDVRGSSKLMLKYIKHKVIIIAY